MKANFGHVFFILNDNGHFSLKTVLDDNKLDPDELEDGDNILLEISLSDKSLTAMNALEKIAELEEITGTENEPNSISELIQWLIDRAARTSFLVGRKVGRKEQSALHQEIDDLTSNKF